MPSYGSAFSAIDPAKMAPGTSHDAGVRRFRNTFDLATNGGGGTTEALKVAAVREGNCVEAVNLASSVSLAAINFTIGTLASPAKYGIAQAGPAANAKVSFNLPIAALAADALLKPEDIYLFPSAALPAAGTLVASLYSSKR